MATRDAGIDRTDFAADHEFCLFHRALNGLHGGLDVHHDPFSQALRRVGANPDHLQLTTGRLLANHGGHFAGADVETDNPPTLFVRHSRHLRSSPFVNPIRDCRGITGVGTAPTHRHAGLVTGIDPLHPRNLKLERALMDDQETTKPLT